MDWDWFVVEGCLDKAWNDHSVTASLAWADGIEEAKSGLLETICGEECVGDSFFKCFGIGVGPTNFLWSPDNAIVGLGKRLFRILAVNL